jgi:hypothetical protein
LGRVFGDIADMLRDNGTPETQHLTTRCSLATVAWVAVHDNVLPDFRRRGLTAGYALNIMMFGWTVFDVDVPERGPFIVSVLDCEDVRLDRDDVDGSDAEDGEDWGDGSGSWGDESGSGGIWIWGDGSGSGSGGDFE